MFLNKQPLAKSAGYSPANCTNNAPSSRPSTKGRQSTILRAECGMVTVFPGVVDNVSLDEQIVFDEFSRVGVVGMDAAHLGGCQNDVFRFFGCKKGLYSSLVAQV